MNDESAAHRCGRIAIVGRPNVGKSTLLNALIGAHVSITAPKPQTTRYRIAGIRTEAHAQLVFLDTPGFQLAHRGALNRMMNRGVETALAEADVCLWVSEAAHLTEADNVVLALLQRAPRAPVVWAINKIDRLRNKSALLPHIAEVSERFAFQSIVPVSAKSGAQLDLLVAAIVVLLPAGGAVYEPDQLSDRSERFFAAEFIREALFRGLGDEIPYATSVSIDSFAEEGKLRRINASIVVAKESQKAVVIGAGGARLRAIAGAARRSMETLFQGKVFLSVWVKVKSGWQDDERELKRLGYHDF